MRELTNLDLLDAHAFAIADASAVAATDLDLPWVPLVPDGLEGDASVLPRMLETASLTPTQKADLFRDIDTACRNGEPPLVPLLMQTDASAEATRVHLVNRLILSSPLGRCYLRFFDPRVWVHLRWILKPKQHQMLIGRARRWTFWFDGVWFSDSPSSRNSSPSWQISATQRHQLDRLGLLNQILAEQPVPPEADPEVRLAALCNRARDLDAALARARKEHGMRHEQDLLEFGLHALRHGLHFDTHPRMRTLLRSLASEETSYRDATAVLEANDWLRIATESSSLRNPT